MEIMKKTGLTLLLLITGCLPTSIVYAQAKPAKVPATPVQAVASPGAPPTLTRVSFIQTMDAEFKSRDANSDGRVSRAEVEEFERKSALRKSQLNNSALFLRLDADKNGSITATEFQKLITSPVLPDISSIMQRFDGLINHFNRYFKIGWRDEFCNLIRNFLRREWRINGTNQVFGMQQVLSFQGFTLLQ